MHITHIIQLLIYNNKPEIQPLIGVSLILFYAIVVESENTCIDIARPFMHWVNHLVLSSIIPIKRSNNQFQRLLWPIIMACISCMLQYVRRPKLKK